MWGANYQYYKYGFYTMVFIKYTSTFNFITYWQLLEKILYSNTEMQ